MKTVRIVLAGLGNVGRNVLEILGSQEALLRDRYGLAVTVVGAVDSKGGATAAAGLDRGALLTAKAGGRSVGEIAGVGQMGMTGADALGRVKADVLFEATPVNLDTGEPGLDNVRTALDLGMACVVANKGPLALAYRELAGRTDLSSPDKPAIRFSACVGGALPTVNIGRRDLAGARILAIESILNGTSQGILRAMESGGSFEAAVAEMQRRGLAETDPSLDVDGWDQAVKLVILANAVLGRPTVLSDLSVTGIRGVTSADLQAAIARGERLVLLGSATRDDPDGDWTLTVAPTSLPITHPLGRMGADEMGIVYRTDISGVIHATSGEIDAVPTAAAMLRDLIDIAS